MGVEKRTFCCFPCRSVAIFRFADFACVVLRAVRLICWMPDWFGLFVAGGVFIVCPSCAMTPQLRFKTLLTSGNADMRSTRRDLSSRTPQPQVKNPEGISTYNSTTTCAFTRKECTSLLLLLHMWSWLTSLSFNFCWRATGSCGNLSFPTLALTSQHVISHSASIECIEWWPIRHYLDELIGQWNVSNSVYKPRWRWLCRCLYSKMI